MGLIQDLTQKRMAFGAWSVFEKELLDPERCRRVRASGIDFAYVHFDADHKNVVPILEACREHDLMVIGFDPKVMGLFADQAFRLSRAVADYKEHPALAGFSLRDEPGVADFARLRALTDACLAAAPDKMPAINLYPNYASDDQLGCASYEEYIDRYADELAIDTISYDFYPLYGTPDGETWLQDNYLRNFEVVARACRRKNCDLWYFIQTLAFNRICREPSEADIRWQIYCAMSFGAKAIQLFTYGTPENGEETFEDAMIGRDGQPTARYWAVQKVIGEMNRITPAYVPYRWQGAMTRRSGLCSGERTIEVVFPGFTHTLHLKGNYLDLDQPLDEFAPVKDFGGEYPLLMGCFEKGGARAFTLVNMEDPGRGRANRAWVELDEPRSLRVSGKDGTSLVHVQGKWEVTLACGEGLFAEIME
jgi:hypothetical protein